MNDMKIRDVMSFVDEVVGVYSGFVFYGTSYNASHNSPKNGRMVRVEFVRKGTYSGSVYKCCLFVRGEEMVVTKVWCFDVVAEIVSSTWVNIGDPDFIEKIRKKLGEYLNCGR